VKRVGLSSFVLLALIFSLAAAVGLAKEITFLTVGYSGELINYLRNEVVPEFRENYGADVVMLTANWNTRMERIIVLTAGGTPPDVVCTGAYSPYEEGSLGMLEPLDNYLARWPLTPRFSKGLWDAVSWRGRIYAVPQNLSLRGIAYNKELYAEVGLDPERPPMSWDELTQFAQRLTRVEGDMVAVQGIKLETTPAGAAQWFFWFLRQAGVAEIDSDQMTSNLMRPEAIDALQTLQELYAAGQHGLPVMSGAYVKGREAMRWLFPSGVSSMIAQDPDIMGRTGVFAPRRTPESRPVAHVFANGLAIPSASKNKDLAWEWISSLYQDDVLYEIQRISWFFSGRLDFLNRMREVQPGIEYWYAMDQYIQASVFPPPRDVSQQELGNQVLKAWRLETSPLAALEQTHALWTRLLADWKADIESRYRKPISKADSGRSAA
jgi:ABC-type glycerol-3-phosphate transport system substrate-binding protein